MQKIGYVYRIDHILSNKFYIGSRSIRDTKAPKDDLWIKYFTSSKIVKDLVNFNGKESFSTSIISIHNTYLESWTEEQTIISKNIGDINCLNQFFYDIEKRKKIFSNFGNKHTEEQKKRWSEKRKGIPKTDEQKVKLSESTKGRPSHLRGKKLSPEHRAKISEAGKNRESVSDETRKKLSESHRTRDPLVYKEVGRKLKGRKFSEESRRKMSVSHKEKPAHNKGIPTTRLCCYTCRKEVDIRNYKRYHSNC
jgi:hypothetical protein